MEIKRYKPQQIVAKFRLFEFFFDHCRCVVLSARQLIRARKADGAF
ncbi:MAG: hypothetical protein ACJASV_002844 [Pseudorhodobacter sp.]|jgi:hypothetical protein